MTTPDDTANNLIATGALYAVLFSSENRQITRVDVDGNALIVGFSFLRSPYRVTVERIPEVAEPDLPPTPTMEPCPVFCVDGSKQITCGHQAGHSGTHRSPNGDFVWVDEG